MISKYRWAKGVYDADGYKISTVCDELFGKKDKNESTFHPSNWLGTINK